MRDNTPTREVFTDEQFIKYLETVRPTVTDEMIERGRDALLRSDAWLAVDGKDHWTAYGLAEMVLRAALEAP
jgi:hypothetical protein